MNVRRYLERSIILERHARNAAGIARVCSARRCAVLAGEWARLSYRLGRRSYVLDRRARSLIGATIRAYCQEQ